MSEPIKTLTVANIFIIQQAVVCGLAIDWTNIR